MWSSNAYILVQGTAAASQGQTNNCVNKKVIVVLHLLTAKAE